MNFLPLFYYPTTCILVDDDPLFLQVMEEVIASGGYYVEKFYSSLECLNMLNSYRSFSPEQLFLKSLIMDESYGYLTHNPIDFDITTLYTLKNNLKRFQEISVIVIDYDMPEVSGYDLAKSIVHLPIQKLILSGKAQCDQAIAGFNSGLIQRFIQKGEVDLDIKLENYLHELSLQYFQKITQPLLNLLEAEAQTPLTDPAFISFFNNYTKEKEVKEYYAIDKKGSFLCIDKKGNNFCLVIESDKSINDWLEMHDAERDFADKELLGIRNRKEIPFFGIGKEAWQVEPSSWKEYFYKTTVLAGRSQYYWTEVNLKGNVC